MRIRLAMLFGVFVAMGAGCARQQSRAAEIASAAWSCPEDRITVTALGGDAFHVAGCGKQAEYACEDVQEKEGMETYSRVECKPLGQAKREADAQLNAAVEQIEVCKALCDSGERGCLATCEDGQCRSICASMAAGCIQGCAHTERSSRP
jgi:hypothetical protein